MLYFYEIDKASLPYVGGKGANLGELTKSGFPVPQGFCITTSAFQSFIQTSNEMDHFFDELNRINADNLDEIRRLGQLIRSHLESRPIPSEVKPVVVAAWKSVGEQKAYAVRSSATAEDLPTASFAGQQDTYLNVCGYDQLLKSIQRCWASLFTDRAIAYRAKNGFNHREVLLSVVVQEMIFPDVSGIMFTADPISGNRKITSIDASFGLGEALVSGLVSADLYQVRDGQIIGKKISKKKISISAAPAGGTVTNELSLSQQNTQSLPDIQILQLAELGRKIEEHYGSEQDIEWCFANGRFYIVQSRPITSLYPIPLFSDNLLHPLISMGHIQMMTEVIKPLGISIFQTAIPFALEAGGRLFADLTPILSVKPLRKIIPRILKHMDELLGTALEDVISRSDVHFPSKRVPLRKVMSFARPVITTVIKNLLFADTEYSRTIATHLVEQSVYECKTNVLNASGSMRIATIKNDLKTGIPSYLPKVVPYFITSILAFNIIERMLQKWLSAPQELHLLNRSLPGNVTSELGLMIGDLADIARRSPDLSEFLSTRTDENFYDGLEEIPEGHEFLQKMKQFMSKYGMRCPGEIDITRPRWREVPTTLVPAIMSHIRTVGPNEHRSKFDEGRKVAEETARNIVAQVHQRKGVLRAKFLKRMINVYRNLGGLREHHKYLLVQHLDIYKQALLTDAKTLVESGVFDQESDVFYLSLSELDDLRAGNFAPDIHQFISERKRQYEQNKKLQPPRVMTSEGEIVTGRRREMNAPEGAFIGTPVSAGVVEGYAKVVQRPEEAKLNPGEIMIAPFTDPGWTPLFHSAKGLVMEVGGMMTHGAVVAREYGIPAVVGIDSATKTIEDGTYIRIDGTQGYVQILREPKQD